MDSMQKMQIEKTASVIRQYAMEAVQRANSGHPGLPMGCAEIGAVLFGSALNHNPKNPTWINRDRFVLSAGHGSMLLYTCLFLSGFDLSLEDIKNFRKLNFITPGHPEYNIKAGIEATTGPLGQGIGNAVGMALSAKILKEKFNTESKKIFTNKIFCLASDGCMMEGASSEAASLAGHLRLNDLIVIYDDNKITLDGTLSESYSDDTKARYRAYGWDVVEIDGHDIETIDTTIKEVRKNQQKPVLIVAHTIIGKGSPHKAGTNKAHGSPLGEEEVKASKLALGLSSEEFYVPQSVYNYFNDLKVKQQDKENNWNEEFRIWSNDNKMLSEELEKMRKKIIPDDLEKNIQNIEMQDPISGRKASQNVLNILAEELPYLYSGSADLSSSDMTFLKHYNLISYNDFSGRNIKFGVREFAMGTVSNGLALSGVILPVCGTFLVFSDYMRNAIRLAALSHLQIVYQFTHDSIFLGEDGPTHQPVEHLASLRAMPNLHVIRPCDSWEVKMAWIAALKYKGPTAIILSRQSLPELDFDKKSYSESMEKGAYIVKDVDGKADFTLIATGSEVYLALQVCDSLEKVGKKVKVISFPCFELFEKQSQDYKNSIFNDNCGKCVSIEAASDFGWHKYIGKDGIAISVDTFGKSAPASDLKEEFGFSVDSILQRLLY